MTGVSIHQLVHGYEHGHSLLAASTELDREDLDLVGRLSDLSGALGPDLEIVPYLTMYPLPSARFYAIARTWPDDSAPRSGCVLTQTILIPTETWAAEDSPSRFAAVLSPPTRTRLADYTIPIERDTTVPHKVATTEPLGEHFVHRYFGEGLAPIVWFGALNPEAAAWCVIQALWPNLRMHFACCTLALQPRTLGNKPFDLVFAPPTVFSRFGEFPRDHIVDSRVTSHSALTETWLRSWSNCLFEGSPIETCNRVNRLSSYLDPYPTAIRSVFFFLDLEDRASESPTAALGALDLLDKLSLEPSRAQREKCALTTAAMHSIKQTPPREAQELLYLLCTRIQEHSLTPGQDVETEIRHFVKRLIRDDPGQGIIDANSLTMRHAEVAPTLFMLGVADAIEELLGSGFAAESMLNQPRLMENLLQCRPEIPARLLRLSDPSGRKRIVASIVDWSRAEKVSSVRPALRLSLLPAIMSADDTPLVEELLRDLGSNEVAEVCNIISSGEVYRAKPLSDVVSRLIGERQPKSVRVWSRTRSAINYQAAAIIAGSYPATIEGLEDFLSTETANSGNASVLLAAFMERVSPFSPPAWLLSLLEKDLRCWDLLLAGITDESVLDVVAKLIRGGLKRSPIARITNAIGKISALRGPSAKIVKDHATRQLILDYLEDLVDIEKVRAWFSEPWVVDVLTHIRPDSVVALITDELGQSQQSWIRVWHLLENVPSIVASDNELLVHEVIYVLLQKDHKCWTVEAADSWKQVLSKISSGDRVRINLCGQALHFALEHRSLPIAGVVAETFYPVHEAAMQDRSDRGRWFLWGFGNWDKAKDLRRSLVDAFLQSDWPPPQFALAAREPWLLRKLSKRMLRQWKGEQFLESAYIGLRNISKQEHRDLLSVLRQIVQNPEIAEDWD